VPCKHIAAVFYLLAEAFDDDPFSILAWRGRTREDLLAGLHAARGGVTVDPGEPGGVPLADCLGSFFAMPPPLPVTPPPTPRRAGPPRPPRRAPRCSTRCRR